MGQFKFIVPMLHKNLSGSSGYGSNFHEDFLFNIKNRYEGEYFLYEFTNEDDFKILASTSDDVKCNIETGDILKVKNGESVWSTDCPAVIAVGFFPFEDSSGRVAGFIKVEMTRQPIIEQIRLIEKRLTIVGLVLVAVITGISALTLLYLMKPLKDIVSHAHRISAEISSGNVLYRGNVDDTSADFREVIDAINSIIAALREREILLQAIIEGIPAIVYYLDSDNVVLWANRNSSSIIPTPVGYEDDFGSLLKVLRMSVF